MLKLNGKTSDGKLVVGGIFEFCATTGYPLEFAYLDLKAKNIMIDWWDYILSAAKEKQSTKTTVAKLNELGIKFIRNNDATD